MENLPTDWKSLNPKLHNLYGYPPQCNLHSSHANHLAQLKKISKAMEEQNIQEFELVNNWITNIQALVDAKNAHEICEEIASENNSESSALDTPVKKKAKTTSSTVSASSHPTPVSERKKKDKKTSASSIEINELKIGYDFAIESITNMPAYVANMENLSWKSYGRTHQLNDKSGNAAHMVLFGKLNRCLCGIYGDFNSTYHNNIYEKGGRWMQWRIIPTKNHMDEFGRQTLAIQKFENMISENFASAEPGRHAYKNPLEFQITRKLIGVPVCNTSFFPEDKEGLFNLSACLIQ